MSETRDVVENCFGVYLLICLNPKYKGRTYIGFTVDPNRRIKQHNKGKIYGGAWKTSNRGPWEMVLIIHGFPSDVAALRFEWAWQHPKKSRRLKLKIATKKAKESSYDYCIKIMWIMLRTPPWCRLPLTLRWLTNDYVVQAPPTLSPPMHMPILFGPIVSKKIPKSPQKPSSTNLEATLNDSSICMICEKEMNTENGLSCLNMDCQCWFHIICLSDKFLNDELLKNDGIEEDLYIPVEGTCPICNSTMLWGDLVKKKNGCYKDSGANNTEDSD